MITTAALRRAMDAALAAGAGRADVYHRRAQTRFLVKEPTGRLCEGTRAEEGVAVRAWTGDGTDGPYGFAAGTGESETEVLQIGRTAAAAARSSGTNHHVAGPAETGAGNESRPADPVTRDEELQLFDPQVLRLTPRELRRHLARFEEACGAVRRPGLIWALGVELHLGVVEATTLTPDGVVRAHRSTLVSVQVRFPNAFGLGRLEIVSRRVDELEPSLLSRMLASYPVRAERLERVAVRPTGRGDAVLILAPALVAGIAAALARKAVAGGRELVWASAGELLDDPRIDWAPGSRVWDANGRPTMARRLAGPAAAGGPSASPALTVLHDSVREPPRSLPTNLVLRGVPTGTVPDADTAIHLLELITCRGDTLMARGVVRGGAPDGQPVIAYLRDPLESLFRDELRAGSLKAFFATGAFAAAPELILPGVEIGSA